MGTNVKEILDQLRFIKITFGIGGGILIFILLVAVPIAWTFLQKKFGRIAEEASEKSLKKFQSEIDKENFKFQIKHQKQIDTIQEVYQKLQDVISIILFLKVGDKFYEQMHPQDEMKELIARRHAFKNIYFKNRLVFSRELRIKIEELLPVIDEFVGDYIEAISPEFKTDEYVEIEGTQLAGIWPIDKLDIKKLESISRKIEDEFRKLLGVE